MRNIVYLGVATALACLWGSGASAQSGAINKAVGGYSFEDAAKEAPTTKKDGKPLTFAIITHTAGNGFFDPVYVGAQVAANAFGINLIRLGSEAPVDDIPREIQILNQIVNDPTINGVIMTTPQVGAYNDIVKKLEERGVVVATTNSFDGTLLRPQQHQPYRPGRVGGGDRRRGDRQMPAQEQRQGRLDPVPEHRAGRQYRSEQSRHRRLRGDAEGAEGGRPPARTSRSTPGPNNIGVDVGTDITAGPIVQLIESRKDVVGLFGPNGGVTPAIGDAISQLKTERQDLLLRLRPRTQAARADQDRRAAWARSASSRSCRASIPSCSSTCRSTATSRRPISTRAPSS